MNKKVLIVTYYWPPAGGPGVQRVLKFAKYLPEFGWDPIILTVQNGEYPAIDESLAKDIPEGCKVYKTKALEPSLFYRKFTGMKSDEKIPVANLAQKNVSWKKKLSNWIRLNLFVPDAKIGWIPYAVAQGKKIIREEQPDIIFSSSPPPTVHLIANKLSKWSGLKWVADFRDPWTEIHYYKTTKRSRLTRLIDATFERKCLDNSNAVTCVSNMDIELDYKLKVKDKNKFYFVPNGYDESDFEHFNPVFLKDKIVIAHSGSVGIERSPEVIFKIVRRLTDESLINERNFELLVIGKIEPAIVSLIESYKIEKYVSIIPYMPHKASIKAISHSNLLLLLITKSENNKRILPGKTFEYIRMKKPIIALGPVGGEVSKILSGTKTGQTFEYSDEQSIENYLKSFLLKSRKGLFHQNSTDISNFSRQNLTLKLSDVFNKVTNN